MKTAIVHETLGIAQMKQKETVTKENILIEKIKNFIDSDDVSRATAEKRETVT